MNKKAIDSLLGAKRQIDDTITQLIRENEIDVKEIMSTLKCCDLIDVGDFLLSHHAFLDWCVNCGFLDVEEEVFTIRERSLIAHKYVSKNDLINLDKNGNVFVHPSLMYVYLNRGKNE
jgi:hypothetical protein